MPPGNSPMPQDSGRPVSLAHRLNLIAGVVVILATIGVGLWTWMMPVPADDAECIRLARLAVRKCLRAPNTAEFEEETVAKKTDGNALIVNGTVRSKDEQGVPSTSQFAVAFGNRSPNQPLAPDLAILDGKIAFQSDRFLPAADGQENQERRQEKAGATHRREEK
jgi:hypothetical protein